MNPIYIKYYSHMDCDCYKIDLPWTKYRSHTVVLCEASRPYWCARWLAAKRLFKCFMEVTRK